MAMPYLPPIHSTVTAPVPDLGFMYLPPERTVGGVENNPWNPNVNPFPGEFTNPGFNPFPLGYMLDGEWVPNLPDKIVYGQRKSAPVPDYTSVWFDGKQYNTGQRSPKPYQFGQAPGDAREEAADAPFTGFGSGQVGQPGYRFTPGTMEGGKFYSDQPGINPPPNRKLGTFQPWNPSATALLQNRRQL